METCLRTMEPQLNETVKSGKNEYTCIKAVDMCKGCCFFYMEDDIANCSSPFTCDAEDRKDHTSVIYVKKESDK